MIEEYLEKLEKSAEFKKRKSKDFILTHIFFMKSESELSPVQIGFYDKKKDMLTSFVIDESGKIETVPESEVFKKENDILKEIDLKKFKIDHKKADSISEGLQSRKYPQEAAIKKIFILQHLDIGQVWNVTFVTRNFKTLNIKIDAETGEILSDKLVSIISFQK